MTAGFKGVRRYPSGRYGAVIKLPGRKNRSLGTYDTAEEAARAYDKAAGDFHGPTANTNFPLDQSPGNSNTIMDSSQPLGVQNPPRIPAVERNIRRDWERMWLKESSAKGAGGGSPDHLSITMVDPSPPLFVQPEQYGGPISAFESSSLGCHKKKMLSKEKSVAGDVEDGEYLRGVLMRSSSGRYRAKIKRSGRDVCLGTFDTAKEASVAYDTAASEYHGEKAKTNFPLTMDPSPLLKFCGQRCDAKKVHKEKLNGSGLDCVVDGTEPMPISINYGARENNLKCKSKTWGKTKKRKRISNNVEDNKHGGVCKRPSGRYGAEIKLPGQNRHAWLETFDTAEEASLAHDAAACNYHGSKADTHSTVNLSTKSEKRPSLKIPLEKVYVVEPSDSVVDCVVDGTDPRTMSIDFCARENNSGENSEKSKMLGKNVEDDDESLITDSILSTENNFPTSAECVGLSKLVSNFENFKIVVNGSTIDPELPHEIRKMYFDLYSKRKSELHCRLLKSVSVKLAAEIISETTKISEWIRDCELKTCGDNLEIWDKTLAGFEIFGMDVFFIRARINRLLGLLWDSKKSEDRRIECWFREEANDSW